jgi:hypothetical protein
MAGDTSSDRFRVALGKTAAIAGGEDDMPHSLPLSTLTGIRSQRKK